LHIRRGRGEAIALLTGGRENMGGLSVLGIKKGTVTLYYSSRDRKKNWCRLLICLEGGSTSLAGQLERG